MDEDLFEGLEDGFHLRDFALFLVRGHFALLDERRINAFASFEFAPDAGALD